MLQRNLSQMLRRIPLMYSVKCASTLPVDKSISPEQLKDLLLDVHHYDEKYGFHAKYFRNLAAENIIVEFSSPNIAKLFHVGHYRSTVVGNIISNILQAAGHNVCKMNYLGDWGIQFALLAVAFGKYGDEAQLAKAPLHHLFDLYVKISREVKENPQVYEEAQQLFQEMEDGNPDALKFWKRCKEQSVEEFKRLYSNIGIEFDVFSGESMYLSKAKDLLALMKDEGLLTTEDHALKINLSNSDWMEGAAESQLSPVMARKNGTTLYLTRDVAAAIDRYNNHKFDRMIYVTDKSQCMHFQQLFAVLDRVGYSWARKDAGKLIHKTFGRVQKMQTRKGNIVFFSDILEEAYQRAHQDRHACETRKVDLENENVTRTLALSGLVYHDLKSRLDKGYKFNWDIALASKGSSGMYLQYTHSRLCSLEKYTEVRVTTDVDPYRILMQPSLVVLIEHLERYCTVTQKLYETLEPSYLVKYLYELCHLASKAFTTCIVKGQDEQDGEARLLCFHCAKIVLANGLRLLGITPLEQH